MRHSCGSEKIIKEENKNPETLLLSSDSHSCGCNMVVSEADPVAQMALPPGFRFFPTDEELLVQYLCRKVAGHHFKLQIIGEIDLYKFDPWVLPGKALFGEKEWYFFSPRDRKYPNGSRPNRVAGTGYWKATGTDKIISTEGRKVGIKKALVFYVGKAPNGIKTNWIMHEYRLLDSSRKIGSSKLDDWVLCRIYEKIFKSSQKQICTSISGKECRNGSPLSSSSEYADLLESFPEIDDRNSALQDGQKLNFQSDSDRNFDWESLVGRNSPPALASEFNQTHQIAQGMNCSYGDINIPDSIPQFIYNEYSPVNYAGNAVEDGVQSGVRAPAFQPNSLLNSSLNSVDPYGFGYSTHYAEFGFGQ